MANLARIKSSGYVNNAAVIPAIDPAKNRRTGGNGLKYKMHTRQSVKILSASSHLQKLQQCHVNK